ncbi:aminoglycoside phosphotransferase family protein [Streptomyces erythrochromogenes]|uniref:aminoglycoside phosphotransferase family protein n=1 Tax=Streptomyces erythrochromogenes TaxID=285574 RepID=UPI0036417FA6
MTCQHVDLYASDAAAPPLRISLDGHPAAHPSRLVEAVEQQTGLRVAILRVESEHVVHVEFVDAPVTTRPAAGGEAAPAWQQPGWLTATTGEADVVLNRLGLRRTGMPVQERHTAVTGMLRIPVGESSLWLKAGLPLFQREAPVTRWVGARADATELEAPVVLAAGDAWWLTAAFPNAAERPAEDSLAALVRLQAASVGHAPALRTMGCPDRTTADLADEIDVLAQRTDLLNDEQRRRLRRVGGAVAEAGASACERLPDTLVHGDFHSGNVRWTGRRWMVYDWTDACVAHPFADLASAVINDPPAKAAARTRQYADAWSAACPGRDIEAALWTAPIIGAAFHAVNYRGILDAVAPPGTGRERIAAREPTAAQLVELLDFWVARLISVST